MNFPDGLFPAPWFIGAVFPCALILFWVIRTVPWGRLADGAQLNVWLGSIVALTLLWSLKAGVKPGLDLHLLGATALTLMFGRQLAIAALFLVLAGVTLNAGVGGIAAWQAFALNGLILAVFPPFVAQGILRAVERWLPPQLFVYIFAAAFFGAAACVIATGLVACLLLWSAGVYGAELLATEYFPYYLLLGFSEAWLNGAAITLMIIYYPRWVGSFDDRRYLWQRNKGNPS